MTGSEGIGSKPMEGKQMLSKLKDVLAPNTEKTDKIGDINDALAGEQDGGKLPENSSISFVV